MKRNIFPIIFILALISFSQLACENNNEIDLYGIEPCDTTNLSWENGIAAIYNAHCVYCHHEDENYKNIRHDSYEQELLVISDGGKKLKGAINHQPGYTKMPFEKPKLSDCKILKIETWIDNGAPEK